MGMVASQFEWNWETADRQFRRSVEEGPSDETARSLRSIFLAAMGRTEEALRESRAAEQLAPGSSPLMSNVPWIHAHARHFEEAAAGWRSLLEVDPHADFARSELVFALNRLGRVPEAHEVYLELRKSIPPRRERGIDLWVMEHEVAAGMRAEAMKTMEYWIARRGRELVEEYDLASMCSVLGRRDEAMKWLELAYENRSSSMFLLRADPSIDALRGDPRFEALVKRMKFPE
jgi:serine/threonine-protein kinase